MSGSRSILLQLSVRDADVVRQQLVAMGDQGAQALAKLDAAAQKAGTGAGGSGGGMRGLGQAAGQAGFQIQDFATQVSMGQNALTAFGAQASQFLGIFGTGGAIAGAVLTVGVLAAQFLKIGENTDAAEEALKRYTEAEEAYRKALEATLEITETSIQRTARLGGERRSAALLGVSEMRQQLEGDLYLTRQRLLRVEPGRPDAITNVDPMGVFQPGATGRARSTEEAGLLAQIDALTARLAEIEAAGRRISAIQYSSPIGPDAPAARRGGGGGTTAGTPESLRATLDGLRARVENRNTEQRNSFEDLLGSVSPAARALRDYEKGQENLSRFLQEGTINEQEFTDAVEATTLALGRQLEEIERRGSRAGDMGRELGMVFNSAFEDLIVKGGDLSDVLKAIEQDIARIIIRQGVTAPLGNALSAAVKPATDAAGSFFSSLFSSGTAAVPVSGALAGGGPVSAGNAYLVGENGPEIMVANRDGAVIPNRAVGGVTFSPTYNIDARGADPSMMPRLRAEMAQIAAASIADLEMRVNRGGSAARTFGRR